MNSLRFQPINVNLPPVSVQVVLLENRTGRGAGVTHTPHLSGKPEVKGGPPGRAPASPGSYSWTDWQEVREELLPFFSARSCSIAILQCHLQGTRALRDDQGCGQLGWSRKITLIIRAFDPRKVRALEKHLLIVAVQW